MPRKRTKQDYFEERTKTIVGFLEQNSIPYDVKMNNAGNRCLVSCGFNFEQNYVITTETEQLEFENILRKIRQSLLN